MKKVCVIILLFSLFWFVYGICSLATNSGLFATDQIVYRYDTSSEYVSEQDALSIRGYVATLSLSSKVAVPAFVWSEEKGNYFMSSFLTEKPLEIPNSVALILKGTEVMETAGKRIGAYFVTAFAIVLFIIFLSVLIQEIQDSKQRINIICTSKDKRDCAICPEKKNCTKYTKKED